MKKFLNWIGYIYGALSLLATCVFVIWGLIEDPVGLLRVIGGGFGPYLLLAAISGIYIEFSKHGTIDWSTYKSFKFLRNILIILCVIFSWFSVSLPLSFLINDEVKTKWFGSVDAIIGYSYLILLAIFLTYTFISFVKASSNALFLVRSFFVVFALYFSKIFLIDVNLIPQTSNIGEFGIWKHLLWMLARLFLIFISVKCLFITVSKECRKVFPTSKRKIPIYDMFIVAFLVVCLLLIYNTTFVWK